MMRYRLSGCLVRLICAIAPVAHAVSVSDFNLLPELPYDATTVEQDALIKIANSLAGDSIEADQLAACQQLLNDPDAPPEIRRWAYLRQIELRTYIDDILTAIDLGREWLRKYPDDPKAREIRIVLTQLVAQRRSEGGPFTYELFEELFADVFDRYTADEVGVDTVYLDYAVDLIKYSSTLSWQEVQQKGRAALERAAKELGAAWDSAVLENQQEAERLQSSLLTIEGALYAAERRMKAKAWTPEDVAEAKEAKRQQLEARKAELLADRASVPNS